MDRIRVRDGIGGGNRHGSFGRFFRTATPVCRSDRNKPVSLDMLFLWHGVPSTEVP